MINLIIFDLDGVLTGTERLHTDAFNSAVNIVTGYNADDFISHDGSSTKSKLIKLTQILGLNESTVAGIDSLKQKLVLDKLSTVTIDMVKHRLISTLSRKYVIALASNSRRENVDIILHGMGIHTYFDSILTGCDVLLHKPNPEIFNTTMRRLGISPQETLILEDSPAGKYAVNASNAHLLEVNSVSEVTLEFIENEISRIETNSNNSDGGIR